MTPAPNTTRAARARDTLIERFEREADPDGIMGAALRRTAAEERYAAHMRALALKSGRTRKAERLRRDLLAAEEEMRRVQAECAHAWPGDLEAAARCMYCDLPWSDWEWDA